MASKDAQGFPAIELSQVADVVRRATGRDSIQVHDWQIQQLGGGVGNPVSAGLYRLRGSALSDGEEIPWSVILKVIQSPANVGWSGMGEGDDTTHWNYWKREILVYQSDFLQALPEGLVAPRCYGAEERPGQTAWLWLEDITDSLSGNWSLEGFARTARHLGRLNGKYALGGALPGYPWLSQNLTQQWIQNFLPELQGINWDHPQVQAHYPSTRPNPFRRMLSEVNRFQVLLARLPLTICHGDTYPTNFMSRLASDGQEQTVALDWALMQVAPLGDDLGQFVFGAQMNLKETTPAEIHTALFDGYLAGLRDSGCQVDPQWVRLGFTVAGALRVGLFHLLLLGSGVRQKHPKGSEPEREAEYLERFEVTMAAEAYRLLETLESPGTEK